MTACVNRKHTKKVAAVVTASLVGALSLGVAPVAAMAATDANMGDVWNDGTTFAWNVEPKNGEYAVQVGEEFILTDITDPYGDPVSMSDVTVVYVQDTDRTAGLSSGDTLYTETPEDRGAYIAVVIPEKVWVPTWATTFGDIIGDTTNARTQAFSIVAKSLEGASAYQGDDVTDTTFKYTGFSFNDGVDDGADIHFVDAAGNKLVEGEDYTVVWKDVNGNVMTTPVKDAGQYKAVLTAVDGSAYEGAETVDITVGQIDLAKDNFTVTPVANGELQLILNAVGSQTYVNWPATETAAAAKNHDFSVYVNGDKINTDEVWLAVTGGTKWDEDDNEQVDVNNNYGGLANAELDLNIIKGDAASPNFVDDSAHGKAKLIVAGELIDSFFYDGNTLGSTLRVDLSKNESFNASLITAEKADGKEVPVTVKVYDADGEEVTDYSTPGSYTVVVEVTVPKDYKYAGSKTFQLNVVSKRFSEQPKVFASIDGKNADGAEVEYDGEAVEPVVAAKAGSATVDPADYTVTYKDAEGNAVESVVEPGKYTATVDFGEAYYMKSGVLNEVKDVTFSFEVTKAQLRSAKADKDLYDATGAAVTPTFTAYNQEDLDGLSIEIDPAETGVTYYKAVWGVVDYGNWLNPNDDVYGWVKSGAGIKASDLKKAGKYVAEVTAPADDPHFQGSVTSEMFEISEYAVFSDVDASEWYADSVYNAAKLGYMTGISGTDLFMPKADITRAELAKVFANMAGGADEGFKNPTQFDDVDPVAWYAEPIAWASEAGIVTGYDESTFGPMDKASREQVATMLYRYAKNQGKDVSVDDADAALAAYKDGDQVSDWAKTAMAWAVENGIFGVDTEELYPTENIQRCAVATIAVRFQPEALPEA